MAAENGNGSSKKALWDMARTLITAGIMGLITMWGATTEIKATVAHLCGSMTRIEGEIRDLRERINVIGDRQQVHYGVSRDNNVHIKNGNGKK